MRHTFRIVVLTLLLGAVNAQAASWPDLPAACTPERAVKWADGKSEAGQAACHCPPTSMCPKTYEAYSNSSLSPIPMKFVLRCCPVIHPEFCPSDSQLANQPVPHDGNCNPYCPTGTRMAGQLIPADKNCNPVCPTGTTLAGQPLPGDGICNVCPVGTKLAGQHIPADKNCDPVDYCPAGTQLAGQPIPPNNNCSPFCQAGTQLAGKLIPDSGNCNPDMVCPSKFYPTLAQSQISSSTIKYVYQNGSSYDFNGRLGVSGSGVYVKRLEARYGWSLRLSPLTAWRWGQDRCKQYGSLCPVQNVYSPTTNGVNNGTKEFSSLYSINGANNYTWFGLSVAGISQLADNLANDAVLAEWGTKDIMKIAENGAPVRPPADLANCGSRAQTNKKCSYVERMIEQLLPKAYASDYDYGAGSVGPVMQASVGSFVQQCFNAAGEYIELERINANGRQCAYLQCRYIYESTAESCLAATTAITLADGKVKSVADLKLGDVVKGAEGDHKIIASNVYQSALRVLYGINGGDAMLTGDHPIRTTKGWKVITDEAAKLYAGKEGFAQTKLEVGDILITEAGEVPVTSITRFPKVDPIGTYNIKVEGNHGFYANGIEVKGFTKMEMHYE